MHSARHPFPLLPHLPSPTEPKALLKGICIYSHLQATYFHETERGLVLAICCIFFFLLNQNPCTVDSSHPIYLRPTVYPDLSGSPLTRVQTLNLLPAKLIITLSSSEPKFKRWTFSMQSEDCTPVLWERSAARGLTARVHCRFMNNLQAKP